MRKHMSMLIGVILLIAPLRFAGPRAADATITGKWITDTVILAAQQKKALEEARRDAMPIVDPFAGQGVGGGLRGQRGARGARGARGGNNFLPAVQQAVPQERQEKRAAVDEEAEDANVPFPPAVTMDLKADKAKVTGTIVETSPEDLSDAKMKVEDGTVKDKSFKFVTYKKIGNLQVGTAWVGELMSENTIKLTRQTLSGKPIDEVGAVTFTRTK